MDEGFFVQIVKKAGEIRLSAEKKAEFRRELELAMLRHPVPEQVGFRLPGWISMHRLAFASSLIGAVVLASGTGVSLAAEHALPGDQLYSVKTGVNERVREAFSLTSQAKISWEMQRIERRIAEADELSSSGRLDQDTRLLIEDEATEYASRVEELAADLEDEDSEKEYIEARLQQAFESGAKVKASFEKRKVTISEREEGVHDEENEPYDDEESDERERRGSEEGDEDSDDYRSESMKKPVAGASAKADESRDDGKSSEKKRSSSSVTEKSEKSGSTASSGGSDGEKDNEEKSEENDDEDKQDEDQKDENPDESESDPDEE
jgi:hypothetical protein